MSLNIGINSNWYSNHCDWIGIVNVLDIDNFS